MLTVMQVVGTGALIVPVLAVFAGIVIAARRRRAAELAQDRAASAEVRLDAEKA